MLKVIQCKQLYMILRTSLTVINVTECAEIGIKNILNIIGYHSLFSVFLTSIATDSQIFRQQTSALLRYDSVRKLPINQQILGEVLRFSTYIYCLFCHHSRVTRHKHIDWERNQMIVGKTGLFYPRSRCAYPSFV